MNVTRLRKCTFIINYYIYTSIYSTIKKRVVVDDNSNNNSSIVVLIIIMNSSSSNSSSDIRGSDSSSNNSNNISGNRNVRYIYILYRVIQRDYFGGGGVNALHYTQIIYTLIYKQISSTSYISTT